MPQIKKIEPADSAVARQITNIEMELLKSQLDAIAGTLAHLNLKRIDFVSYKGEKTARLSIENIFTPEKK